MPRKWGVIFVVLSLLCALYICFITLNSLISEMKTYYMKRNAKKTILFWTTWFQKSGWGDLKNGQKEIIKQCSHLCSLHTDQKDPLSYDALVFHGYDKHSPPKQRLPNQIYILLIHESPYFSAKYFMKDNSFYNWTASYSPKSRIWIPYWDFSNITNYRTNCSLPTAVSKMSFIPSSNDTTVAWIVSSCKTYSKRERYVHVLKQHIKIDIFGRCGKYCHYVKDGLHRACYSKIAKAGKYKFYLSFENSVCRSYITEKAQNALLTGMVPIVYGGLDGSDYLKMFPPYSFIDVRNFQSPKHLASYLHYLSGNDTAYMEYHTWRCNYAVQPGGYWSSIAKGLCKICKELYSTSLISASKVNISEFWNKNRDCNLHFINEVMDLNQQ